MPDAVTCTSTHLVARATVDHLADLLENHRVAISTRAQRRSLGCLDQAVAFLRWMLDATKIARLARDNAIGLSTAYRCIGEALVITAPDGRPTYTSAVRPGREHDTTCARTHEGLLDALEAWSDDDHHVLADLGYEGEHHRLVLPVKKTHGVAPSIDRACCNALLEVTFTALRHVSISPEHHRTV